MFVFGGFPFMSFPFDCSPYFLFSVVLYQVRSQGSFRVARKLHTWCGSPLAAREPPNHQHVKYKHVLDPRALKLFGYNTFCRKSIKAIRIKLKGLKMEKISWGYTGHGSPSPKIFLATCLCLCRGSSMMTSHDYIHVHVYTVNHVIHVCI